MIDLCLIMYLLYSQFRYVSSVSIRTITINRDIIQLCNASTSAWPSTGPSTNLFNSQLCKHHCKQSIVMIIIILSLSFLGFAFVSTLIFCACWVLDSYTYACASACIMSIILFYYHTFQYFRYYLSGKDMTQQNYDGRTALHVAAAQGKENLLRFKGLEIQKVVWD